MRTQNDLNIECLLSRIHELETRIAELESADSMYKQSQKELTESQGRYRNLMDSSPIPIFVHSEEKIVLINAEGVRALGGESADNFIGLSVWDIIAPESVEITRSRIDAIYNKKSNSSLLDLKFVRLDGTVINVEVMGTITDYKGKPASQVVFKDISKRKLAEKVIEERIRVEQIVNHVSMRLMASDHIEMETTFLDTLQLIGCFLEAQWIHLVIYSSSFSSPPLVYEWCDNTVPALKDTFNRFSPEMFPWWIEQLRSNEILHIPNIDELTPEANKERELLKTFLIHSVTVIPLANNERLLGFIGISSTKSLQKMEATGNMLFQTLGYIFVSAIERKNASESILIQKTYMEELFNSSPDAITILDNNDRVLRINHEFIQLFGYSEEEALGRYINDLIVPGEFKDEASGLTNRIAAHQEIIDVETIRQSSRGTRIHVSIRAKPIFLGSDQLAVYAIYRDISSRKWTEEENRRLEEQLRQAQKMEAIGNLAGGIAHDFNNVLAVIMGYTELAYDRLAEGTPIKNNLKNVLTSAEKAKDLVKQILAFSRKDERKRVPISLAEVLRESLQLLRPMIPSFIEIHTTIPDDLLPVLANSTQIHQVIMNICTNAAHSMKGNGVLNISLREVELDTQGIGKRSLIPGKYQIMTFSDTGCGIKPEFLERVFEPYFTTKSMNEGTGMGLAVVHGIVTSHGGDITVYSKLAKGTTFNVYLPVTDEAMLTGVEKTTPVREGAGRILLVDDDPGLVEMSKLMLESLGYYVVAHTNSQSALETFRTGPDLFDIVITDQTMPLMTGQKLGAMIKEIRPNIPILLCTGFSENINEDNFKEQGIDAFMMKPIIRNELSQTVHNLLKKNG